MRDHFHLITINTAILNDHIKHASYVMVPDPFVDFINLILIT